MINIFRINIIFFVNIYKMSIAQKTKVQTEESTKKKQVIMIYSKSVPKNFLYNTKSLKNVGIMNELLEKTAEELSEYDLLVVNYWEESERKSLIKLNLNDAFVVLVSRTFEKDGKKQWIDNVPHNLVIHELPKVAGIGSVNELLDSMKAIGFKPPKSSIVHFFYKAVSCLLKSV